jgi:hypothetical protein
MRRAIRAVGPSAASFFRLLPVITHYNDVGCRRYVIVHTATSHVAGQPEQFQRCTPHCTGTVRSHARPITSIERQPSADIWRPWRAL